MTPAEIAAALTQALDAAAAREAGAGASLASFNLQILAPGAPGQARVSVMRRTRTLLFLNAEYLDGAGARIAEAASVHKIAG